MSKTTQKSHEIRKSFRLAKVKSCKDEDDVDIKVKILVLFDHL